MWIFFCFYDQRFPTVDWRVSTIHANFRKFVWKIFQLTNERLDFRYHYIQIITIKPRYLYFLES